MLKTDNNKEKKKAGILPQKRGYAVLLLAMMIVAIGFLAMLAVVDAFPQGMTLAFVSVIIAVILASNILFRCEKKWLRIAGIVIAAFFIAIYGLGISYLSTTYATFARISTEDETQEAVNRVNVTEDPFNLYITGIDQWDSEKGLDLERSDVNMIVTVNPKTRKILLTSIPRDTYVPLHMNGEMDKLTHTGVYGVDETINTVQDWLGYDMNYYVKANFSAVVDVINAIGGVDVYSEKEFKPVKRPWWTVKKGWNHMNGKEALAFARERKAFNSEDANRVDNQQKVVKAMLDKMLTSTTLLTKYGDILGAAGDSLKTNMSTNDMQALIKLQLADLGNWDVEMQKIEGEYDTDYVASLTQEQKFLVYKASEESIEKNKSTIDSVMNPSSKEIAEATATRQRRSILVFLKSILKK